MFLPLLIFIPQTPNISFYPFASTYHQIPPQWLVGGAWYWFHSWWLVIPLWIFECSAATYFTDKVTESCFHIQSLPADTPNLVSDKAVIQSLPLKWPRSTHQRAPKVWWLSVDSCFINAILLSGHIPFKHGFIILIPKGHNKDLTLPSNYRVITLLLVIGKVFEKVLLHHQFSRPSSTHFKVVLGWVSHSGFIFQEALSSLRERRKLSVAFLDVKKAFDRVWHDGLMVKPISILFTSSTTGTATARQQSSGIPTFLVLFSFSKECAKGPFFPSPVLSQLWKWVKEVELPLTNEWENTKNTHWTQKSFGSEEAGPGGFLKSSDALSPA